MVLTDRVTLDVGDSLGGMVINLELSSGDSDFRVLCQWYLSLRLFWF